MSDITSLHETEPQMNGGETDGQRTPQTSNPVLVERVRATLKAEGISQAAACREIGVSSAVLSQWLSGAYRGDVPGTESKVETWLKSREARAEAASVLPARPAWFPAPTARKILSTLQYAQMMGDLAVIHGGAGLGKTATAAHYRATNPRVWIATMAPSTKGVVSCLEEVADAVGLRDAGGGARKLARLVRKQIAGTRGLLIVDEAQHLSMEALEELRTIQDATGIGLALVGNEIVYSRLTGGNRGAAFSQLFSRIGLPLALGRPTTADVRALAQAWEVEGRDELAFLEGVAAKPGALRMTTKVLVLATVVAGGKPLGVKHLEQAWRNLGREA